MHSRRGIILVEAMVALATLLVLIGLLAPRVRADRRRARAIRIVAAAKRATAALTAFQTDRHRWPASAGAGLVPMGLSVLTGAAPFQGDDYVLRYVLRSVQTQQNDVLHPILIVTPTDPRTCPDVYDLLGGVRNPNAFAFCGNVTGSVYLFLN
jgi:type II secretory pathway pseudopilin PulG